MLINFRLPFGYKHFYKKLKNEDIKFLDVGCGSHAPSLAKKYFPNCEYSGVDYQYYNSNEEDIKLIDNFYKIDLNKDFSELNKLPDEYYDVIYMSHIIEHLYTAHDVIAILTKKLKPNGKIYIEYPGEKSLRLRSMPETLNFCDDDTHVKVYNNGEIANTLLANNCKVLKAGIRRDKYKIALIPIKIVYKTLTFKKLTGGIFWDSSGFANFIFAEKK